MNIENLPFDYSELCLPRKINEKCGLFGIYDQNCGPTDPAKVTYYGLLAQQHRGQQAAGIASSDGEDIHIQKGAGFVLQVFNERNLSRLVGHIAIGHDRYATNGGNRPELAHPITSAESNIALALNGNLPEDHNRDLQELLDNIGIDTRGFNDTIMIHRAVNFFHKNGASLEESMIETFPLLNGGFSLVAMDQKDLVAVRDHHGFRPLAVGKLNGGYAVASETSALENVGCIEVDEIKPGEMVRINETGIRRTQVAESDPKIDSYEIFYFSRNDSRINGTPVQLIREKIGEILAEEHPVEADLVISVPRGGDPYALGYSRISGIPIGNAFIKNEQIGRVFIAEESIRDKMIAMKLNTIPTVFKGKRVIGLDDSLVRKTSSGYYVPKLLRDGARSVDLGIGSLPLKFSNRTGVDTPNTRELAAANNTVEEIRQSIQARSLNFISREGFIRATGFPENTIDLSNFDGNYPLDPRRSTARMLVSVS
jgi:amidophosphoribosyltransferase